MARKRAYSSGAMSATKRYKRPTTVYRRRPIFNRARYLARSRIGRAPAAQHSFAMLKSVDMKGPFNQVLNSTGAVGGQNTNKPFNAIQAGTGFFNRIGNRITMKSLHLVGTLTTTANVTAGIVEYLRIMVVYDKQANGAAPAITDILLDTAQDATSVTNAWSSTNINNRDRFLILMDDRIDIPNNAATALTAEQQSIMPQGGDQQEVNINRFIKLNDLEAMYKASSSPAVIGDITVGALWLVTLGTAAAGAEGYQLTYNARLRYHDC